jgi:hypothetical protein
VIAARLRLGPHAPVGAFDAALPGPFRDRDIPAHTVPTGAPPALRLRGAAPAPVLLLAGPALAAAGELQDNLVGMRALLASGGIAVSDIPDLLDPLRSNRFELLSHARPCVPSLLVAEMLPDLHGLVPFELEMTPGAGLWLRLLVCHAEDAAKVIRNTVFARRDGQKACG